jgi:hypothetical protein
MTSRDSAQNVTRRRRDRQQTDVHAGLNSVVRLV